MTNVTVVGLSDVGRSPRFQYHCISLAQEGFHVNVIGYKGAKPKKQLISDPNVSISYLPAVPEFNKHLPRLLAYLFKVLWQSLTLLWALALKRRSDFVFVQTPPAIPVFAVVWFYAALVRAKFVIDWHNYAYSIMALTLGEKSVLVKMSYWFECYFGRKAHANICVTKAMSLDLMTRWAIVSKVLYDRPPDEFHRTTIEERHSLFTRLSQRYPVLGGSLNSTAFTKIEDGRPVLRSDRPALLVSSTSWTEDEDFNILLSALVNYDKCDREDVPKIICIITGRGPLKDYYIGIIQASKWRKVTIITPWLEEDDYPLLLGSADLGVSLHTSSSGLDLPMKVVDMFGCGLPVLAHDFKCFVISSLFIAFLISDMSQQVTATQRIRKGHGDCKMNCIHELVRNGQNGFVFKDAPQLSGQLVDWFANFPDGPRRYDFSKAIAAFGALRWHQNWAQRCLLIFKPS